MSRFFNGGPQRLATSGSLSSSGSLTVHAFAKMTRLDPTFGGGTVMGDWTESTNQSFLLSLAAASVSFNIIDSSLNGRGASIAVPAAGKWIACGGVYDAAAAAVYAVYNGFRSGAGAATGAKNAGSAQIGVGARAPGDSLQPFNGFIEHVAIWLTALTPPELQALAQGISPLQIRRASLWSYWPLAEPNGLADRSGNQRNLTVQTGPVQMHSDSPFSKTFNPRRMISPPPGPINAPFLPSNTVVYTPSLSSGPVGTILGQGGAISVS